LQEIIFISIINNGEEGMKLRLRLRLRLRKKRRAQSAGLRAKDKRQNSQDKSESGT
jgi:hypothetical protein